MATARITGKPIWQVITDMAFYYQYVYLANNNPAVHDRIESLLSQLEKSATR